MSWPSCFPLYASAREYLQPPSPYPVPSALPYPVFLPPIEGYPTFVMPPYPPPGYFDPRAVFYMPRETLSGPEQRMQSAVARPPSPLAFFSRTTTESSSPDANSVPSPSQKRRKVLDESEETEASTASKDPSFHPSKNRSDSEYRSRSGRKITPSKRLFNHVAPSIFRSSSQSTEPAAASTSSSHAVSAEASAPPQPEHFDLEFFKKFGIKIETGYTTYVHLDPSCLEELERIWKEHEEELDPDPDHPEVKKFIDCLEATKRGDDSAYATLVEIQWLGKEVGYGLFAKQEIKKNQVIGLYTGELTHLMKVKDLSYAFEWPDTPYEKLFTIDGKRTGNYTRFINHAEAKESNVSTVEFFYKGLPYIVFIADKRIPAGKQLSYDYGPEYWKRLGITPRPL